MQVFCPELISRSFIFLEHLRVFAIHFFYCNVSSDNLLSLFLYFFKKITHHELVSYKLVTFNSDWQLHHNRARHTHNNLSFLVPPPTPGEHIYGVSVIPRKVIFQISPGWLPLLLLFWFNHLYHRYSGEAFSHSLKEVIEDRRKRGKNRKKIRYGSIQSRKVIKNILQHRCFRHVARNFLGLGIFFGIRALW